MKVTPPVRITDAKLISSTLAEPHAPSAYSAGTTYAEGAVVSVAADFAIYESLADLNLAHTPSTSTLWWRVIGPTETAYNAGSTYALGDTVSSASTHRCYESLQAANLGNPLPVLPETETAWWLDVAATNKWAMFDFSRNTQSVGASPLTVVVAPGERVNTVGVFCDANSVTISATSVTGGGTVYGPVTFDLNRRTVIDAYTYFYEPFGTVPSKVVFDLPPYSDIIITVTLAATHGNVKCGGVVVGTAVYIGDVLYQSKNDGLNFSSVTRDLWGNATLVPRRTVPRTTQRLVVDSRYINKILTTRALLNAQVAMWTGIDEDSSDWFEMHAVLGFYKTLEVGSIVAEKADVNLELEEI